MNLPLDVLNRITVDVTMNVPPERSHLTYTPEMLAARRRIEADIAKMPPGTIVDVPNELPPDDLPDDVL
jgi:hypothetical protein